MKEYTAVINSNPVISVLASSIDEAKKKIEKQLNRPGRYEILKAWKDSGSQVEG